MTRTMVDSTSIGDDPLNADLVAYYADGRYATTAAKVRLRFPSAVLVPISAIGTNAGIVGDQEPGCMSIEQAVAWVQARRAMGIDPSIYVNEVYGWAGARHAFDAYGVPEPHWWVADYDGRPIIPAGAVAKQYANPTLTHGHFDRSVVADYWPGVDGDAGDPEHTIGEADMALLDDIHAAVARLEVAFGTALPDASGPAPADQQPSFIGWSRDVTAALADLKNRIETIQQSPAIGAEHTTPPGP